MSWAAGVIDAQGGLYISSTNKGNGRKTKLTYSRIRVQGTKHLCDELQRILGGEVTTVRGVYHHWHVKSAFQEDTLARIMPYLRVQYERASALYQYRLLVRRKEHKSQTLPLPLKEFRATLVKHLKSYRRKNGTSTGS